MSKVKLSPWFSHEKHDKPVNVGVYKTELICSALIGYSMWNGEKWMDTNLCVHTAECDSSLGLQSKRWRGVVK